MHDIHRWLMIVLVLIGGQFTDLVDIPQDPYGHLYLWGAFVESIMFGLIFLIRLQNIWKFLIFLQIASVCCHLGGMTTEWLYAIFTYEPLALINDSYQPWLIFILTMKVLVMLVGINGIRLHMADTDFIDNSGFIVIRDTPVHRIPKR